jgi:hypothetical protein
MYMIVCKTNGLMSYYAQGIHIENIPLKTTDVLALLKVTRHNRKVFRKNLLPALERFLRAYRLWLTAHKSPRYLLQRETGSAGAGALRSFATYYRQTYRKPLFSSLTTLGL